MKRLITAIVLIIFLLTISIASNVFLNLSTKKINGKLDIVYNLAKEENYEECKNSLEDALKEFDELEKYYLLVIRSTPLENITEKMKTLKYYLQFEDKKLFCIETKKTIVLFEHILDTEKPTLYNIF